MSKCLIEVTARVSFLATADGGRKTPVYGSHPYRPNHVFFDGDNRIMCMGEIKLVHGAMALPGESIETKIKFLVWPELGIEIEPGKTWRIQEGPRLVGLGEILTIDSKTSIDGS